MPRLSFSLRDVFWLTLVVGMGVGWWLEHCRRLAVQSYFESAAELLESEGYHHSGNGSFWARMSAGKVWKPERPVGQD